MDAVSLFQALAMAQAAHTGGHFVEASRKDMPMSLDAKNFVEWWGQAPNGPKFQINEATGKPEQVPGGLSSLDRSSIHGAGFSFQDLMEQAQNDPEKRKNMALANAIIKGLYLSGAPNKISKEMIAGGDIGGMERESGNKDTKGLLALSLLADLYKYNNPNSNVDLRFVTPNGAPGVMLDYKF